MGATLLENHVSALVAIFKAADYQTSLRSTSSCLPWKVTQWLMDTAVEYKSESPCTERKPFPCSSGIE